MDAQRISQVLLALTSLSYANVEFPSSCMGQEDGYQWLKPLEGGHFPPIFQKCDRGYMIIDAGHDDNVYAYLGSTEQYRVDTVGPSKRDTSNWEQWWLPNRAFLAKHDIPTDRELQADADHDTDAQLQDLPEFFSYTLSPDCTSCLNSVFDTVENRLSPHNDDAYGDRSAYYMTGATFGCQSLSEQVSMAKRACSTDASQCELCDGEMGLCSAYPHAAYTNKIPLSTEECTSAELAQSETLKPAVGSAGNFCVCYKPNLSYDRDLMWRSSPQAFKQYKAEWLQKQQDEEQETQVNLVCPTYIYCFFAKLLTPLNTLNTLVSFL